MTNDEIRRNDEIRMLKPATVQLRVFDIGLRISFVIRHSSFNDLSPSFICFEVGLITRVRAAFRTEVLQRWGTRPRRVALRPGCHKADPDTPARWPPPRRAC